MDAEPGQTQPSTSAAAGRGRRLVLIALVVILLLVAGTFIVRSGLTGGGEPVPKTIETFQGTGDDVTKRFEATEGWEIRWKTEGRRFAIDVTGARDLGTVVEAKGEKEGATFPAGSGTFRLKIRARGPWRVEVRTRD